MRFSKFASTLVTISLLLTGCSAIKAPVDLTTTTIKTTGNVAVSTCKMTGDVASAAASTATGVATATRAAADLATSPVVREAVLESRGHGASRIFKSLAK